MSFLFFFLSICSLISVPILVKHDDKKLVGIQQNSEHRVGVECSPLTPPGQAPASVWCFPYLFRIRPAIQSYAGSPLVQRRLLHLAGQCLGRVQRPLSQAKHQPYCSAHKARPDPPLHIPASINPSFTQCSSSIGFSDYCSSAGCSLRPPWVLCSRSLRAHLARLCPPLVLASS